MVPYLEKILELLRPYCAILDSGDISRINSLEIDDINLILNKSTSVEYSIADIYVQRKEYTLAEKYCQRCLDHAKRYEGEDKADLLNYAFTGYCNLRKNQHDYINAVTFAEEAYNCVAVAYKPP